MFKYKKITNIFLIAVIFFSNVFFIPEGINASAETSEIYPMISSTPTPTLTPTPGISFSMEANDIYASEFGPKSVTITLSSKLSGNFFADGWDKRKVTIGGTATNGVDYEYIKEYVYVPVGYPYFYTPNEDYPLGKITIAPIPDNIKESDETVDISVAGIGKLTITIEDNAPVTTPTPTPKAPGSISVLINGITLNTDVDAIIIQGRTMVPFRAIFEALGAKIIWDESTRKITGIRGDVTVVLGIESKKATVNGKTMELDVAPIIIDGRTLVPVRFISESLGAKVDWDQNSRTVIITDK